MTTYTPDSWVVVKITGTEVSAPYYRVLGGWYGGGTNNWKLSSGVTSITEYNNYWEVVNTSGSVYLCFKGQDGFTGTTLGIYNKYQDTNCEELTVTKISIEDCVKELRASAKEPINLVLKSLLGSEELVHKWWNTTNRYFDYHTPNQIWEQNPQSVKKYIAEQLL